MVMKIDEIHISQAILDGYYGKLSRALAGDVTIVGAGPAGLMAAWNLSQAGYRVTVLEKRLSAGGGIWGGGIGMNEIVVQRDGVAILDLLDLRHEMAGDFCTVDAAELACALCLHALQSGAVLLNLFTAEDLRVQEGRVTGVVVNRSVLGERFPIDPITFSARAVVDATGHEAVLVGHLGRRNLLAGPSSKTIPGEGAMNAEAGEKFVVDNAGEMFPGLWVAGMAVCAALAGPRMGPIFGGMLLSGQRVAERISATIGPPATPPVQWIGDGAA